jgi:hypothetical protein
MIAPSRFGYRSDICSGGTLRRRSVHPQRSTSTPARSERRPPIVEIAALPRVGMLPNPAVPSQKWGRLSACGPAFQRVQPAGRPAAAMIVHLATEPRLKGADSTFFIDP